MSERAEIAVLLGRALKVLREQAGLTQTAAADRIGCDVGTVGKDEQGGDGSKWTRGVAHRRIGLYVWLYGSTVRELLALAAELPESEDSPAIPVDGSTDRATLET